MSFDKNKLLRNIPAVDEIMKNQEVVELLEEFSRTIVLNAVKQILGALNSSIVTSLNTNIKELAGGKVKELKESVEDKAKEGLDKLKGLLGR